MQSKIKREGRIELVHGQEVQGEGEKKRRSASSLDRTRGPPASSGEKKENLTGILKKKKRKKSREK